MTLLLPGAPPAPFGAPPAAPAEARIAFDGASGDFVHIALKGALLQLVTFGFYRFWLNTDVRRHLWTHTSLDGDHLEYTGSGRELLVGFLFALAILVPIYLIYFLIGVEVERFQAFGSVPLGLFTLFFGQFAIYRARRYRLTRTVWRGVRFWMQGSGWAYALRSFGWLLVVILTLGLAWPWRAASLERYKMRHTFYGDLSGGFHARPWNFFKRGFWLWLVIVTPFVLFLTAAYQNGTEPPNPAVAAFLTVAGFMVLLVAPLLWPYFRALEWRWWASGVRFGDLSLESDLDGWSIFMLYLKFAVIAGVVASMVGGLVIAIGAGASVLAFARKANLDTLPELLESNQIFIVAATMLGYLTVALSVGIVQRFFLQREMWRLVTQSLTVRNIAALEGVAARGEAANAIGEGLADSLDVAGF